MKKIAFYLPQFHSIPENDEWWGKGFTEWVNVKNAKPSFKGHKQPEIPYKYNYYNLLDTNIQILQAQKAREYGLDGFCYYHYWFEGKLLLEKPMENMLRESRIDIPFCICWANETWARTWDGKENQVLIRQNYDEDKECWKEHFQYLLPFFKDKRYICVENRPMFILYKPQLIKKCKEMMEYWNELAVDAGFKGIYFGYQHHTAFDYDLTACNFEFAIEFEPFYTVYDLRKKNIKLESTWSRLKKKVQNLPTIYDYDVIWENIINRHPSGNVCAGAFPAWDNTPRRGRKAILFWESSPQKFESYMSSRIKSAKKYYNRDFLFINAWNEWAEGAHLEPTETYGYSYLEALKRALIENGEFKYEFTK